MWGARDDVMIDGGVESSPLPRLLPADAPVLMVVEFRSELLVARPKVAVTTDEALDSRGMRVDCVMGMERARHGGVSDRNSSRRGAAGACVGESECGLE